MKEITKLNFTIRVLDKDFFQFSYIGGPIQSYDPEMRKFSTLLFLKNSRTRILYCINEDFKLSLNSRMWIISVAWHVWQVILVLLFAIAVVRSLRQSIFKNEHWSYLDCIISYLELVFRFVLRQSASHFCLLLGLVELLVGLLLAAYENSVTVEILVPESYKPFGSTKDLFENNYTFVTGTADYPEVGWLKSQYNNVGNHNKWVIVDASFVNQVGDPKLYYWKRKDGRKFAVADNFLSDGLYNAIKLSSYKNHECYKMFPPDEAFGPAPSFYVFDSVIGTDLKIAYT